MNHIVLDNFIQTLDPSEDTGYRLNIHLFPWNTARMLIHEKVSAHVKERLLKFDSPNYFRTNEYDIIDTHASELKKKLYEID